MRGISLRRPSPAMVVACAALAVALGGTSYATVLQVPRSSVGTAQLKTGAVTDEEARVERGHGRQGSKRLAAEGRLRAGAAARRADRATGTPGGAGRERCRAGRGGERLELHDTEVRPDRLSCRKAAPRRRRARDRRRSGGRAHRVVPGQRQHLPGERGRERRVRGRLDAHGLCDLRGDELTSRTSRTTRDRPDRGDAVRGRTPSQL